MFYFEYVIKSENRNEKRILNRSKMGVFLLFRWSYIQLHSSLEIWITLVDSG